MKELGFLLLLSCVALTVTQYLPFMNRKELREMLRDDKRSRTAVDCILDFDESICSPKLKKVADVAPALFANGMKCTSNCSPQDEVVMERFLQGMQKRHPDYYKKLVRGLTQKAEELGSDSVAKRLVKRNQFSDYEMEEAEEAEEAEEDNYDDYHENPNFNFHDSFTEGDSDFDAEKRFDRDHFGSHAHF